MSMYTTPAPTTTPRKRHAAAALTATDEQTNARSRAYDPHTTAIRLGFDDPAAIAAQLPERLRPHLDTILTRRGLVWQAQHQWTVNGGPATPEVIVARLHELCDAADRAAIRAAENAATHRATHTDQITGHQDPTVRRRWMPHLRQHLLIADTTAAALDLAYAERIPDDVLTAARQHLADTLGPTPTPRTRRKR